LARGQHNKGIIAEACADYIHRSRPTGTDAPEVMPEIQVGDTVVHNKYPAEPPMFMHRVTDYERRGWQGDPNVLEVLRPLWRRPVEPGSE
jgi:hypothetical protein